MENMKFVNAGSFGSEEKIHILLLRHDHLDQKKKKILNWNEIKGNQYHLDRKKRYRMTIWIRRKNLKEITKLE
jgi:hypothetical protein